MTRDVITGGSERTRIFPLKLSSCVMLEIHNEQLRRLSGKLHRRTGDKTPPEHNFTGRKPCDKNVDPNSNSNPVTLTLRCFA